MKAHRGHWTCAPPAWQWEMSHVFFFFEIKLMIYDSYDVMEYGYGWFSDENQQR